MNPDSPFSIGIDLGTTNSALAFIHHEEAEGSQILSIPQLIDRNLLDELPTLPSFLYCPLEEEFSSLLGHLHWETANEHLVGTGARVLGEKTPNVWSVLPSPGFVTQKVKNKPFYRSMHQKI